MNKITDNQTIIELRSTVLSYWPKRRTEHFPAPLPVSIERKDFYKLKKYPYLVCNKTDGTRYLMISRNGFYYLIDRSFNCYSLEAKKSEINFLIDGELIKNNSGSSIYIIHDCIEHNGSDMSQTHFTERYESVKNIAQEISINGIEIRVKKFYKVSEAYKLSQENNDHKIDGLIFTPETLPIGTSTQNTLFKWKPKSKHTIDFKILETSSSFEAYILNGQDLLKYGSVKKNKNEGIKFSNMLKEHCQNFTSGNIVECEFDETINAFFPIVVRTDKVHPNTYSTVTKTLLNIKENITFEEIMKSLQDA